MNHFLTGMHIQVDTGMYILRKLVRFSKDPTKFNVSTFQHLLKSQQDMENQQFGRNKNPAYLPKTAPFRAIRSSCRNPRSAFHSEKFTHFTHFYGNQQEHAIRTPILKSKKMYVCIHIQYIHIILIYIYIHTHFSYIYIYTYIYIVYTCILYIYTYIPTYSSNIYNQIISIFFRWDYPNP